MRCPLFYTPYLPLGFQVGVPRSIILFYPMGPQPMVTHGIDLPNGFRLNLLPLSVTKGIFFFPLVVLMGTLSTSHLLDHSLVGISCKTGGSVHQQCPQGVCAIVASLPTSQLLSRFCISFYVGNFNGKMREEAIKV